MPWEHNLLASVFTTSLNAPTFSRAYLSHNHYINSLCQFCVFYWSYNTLLLTQTFMQGAFETLTDVSPCLWVGFSRYCSRGIFSPEVCRAHFQGGWSACCWEFTVSAPPYEQTFLSMSAFPCSACNAFLIPNATLCRKTFKCSDNNHHSMFQA